MKYCPHCMRPAAENYCTKCGGKVQWENPPHLLPVGTVLQGEGHRYQTGVHLGQGGFGVTYIAMDLDARRRVAIKEYFPTQCARRGQGGRVEPKTGQEALFEGGRYHFVQEAMMLANLEGMPAVVQGLEYMEVNGTAYLVMEYLEGTPLYRIVNEKGRIPAGDLLPRLKPLLRDIGKLHERGVIHRDISPDNVMWMEDGTLKLLDFGCARSVEDGKSMTVLLKHGFAPVEQYQTKGQGSWTDVYALAATVYYSLTGVIPQTATERLMEDQLQSPIALGAALTPEEESALLWAMTVNPKQRPADMAAFSRRLFPLEQPAPQPVPPPQPTPGRVIAPGETNSSLPPEWGPEGRRQWYQHRKKERKAASPGERLKSILFLCIKVLVAIVVSIVVSMWLNGMGQVVRDEGGIESGISITQSREDQADWEPVYFSGEKEDFGG